MHAPHHTCSLFSVVVFRFDPASDCHTHIHGHTINFMPRLGVSENIFKYYEEMRWEGWWGIGTILCFTPPVDVIMSPIKPLISRNKYHE